MILPFLSVLYFLAALCTTWLLVKYVYMKTYSYSLTGLAGFIAAMFPWMLWGIFLIWGILWCVGYAVVRGLDL